MAKCYDCVHRLQVTGNAHSRCNNFKANVKGQDIGVRKGWFNWTFNFDPVWLVSCDGFSNNPADRLPEQKADPLVELLSMLR